MNFEAIREAAISKTNIPRQYFLDILTSCEKELNTQDPEIVTYGKVFKPETIKRYDVVMAMVHNCPHPCVVHKVRNGFVYALGLTTKEGIHNIIKVEGSRYFSNNYFSHTIVVLTEEQAIKKFVGVFDNKAVAREAFKLTELFYQKIFK